MDQLDDNAALKHRIPVIDRMMEVLGQLEVKENGATIRDLVQQLKLPRTTIYRILNSLQLHDMVRRDQGGAYHLGRRLLGLASHVAAAASPLDLVAFSTPVLEKLSGELGEGSKLTIIDKEGVLVLAAVQGRRPYALSVSPGQRMPVHTGASGKLLLAYLPEAEIDAWLSRPLAAYTPRTITDPKRLRTELARIRRLGWAQDKAENGPSILAYAAPVFDKAGKVVAAVSVPFLQGTEASRMEEIRLAVIAAGKAMSASIAAAG
ncbi:MAG TPA: IclR family transcriptional regulator [Devosiaceae bacterium]|jgi:DNA-binding IclR family transcriptional regulator|nr:IclR family transcriptional regulator [Devosiaceae bacterium]